ncbi:pentapeptide repeat-containing protein [Streptomyces sp. NPDC005408]|uniref:pentapeptide repeat-containing protein n=1 Tax=Streptomyces sp. NPDC005408 TaxID=3155341 RepID=UPI0033B06B30
MTTTSTPPPLSPPDWPHCAGGADPISDPVGCRGRRVEPSGECLAHLRNADRATYLSALTPGSDVDHRGTPISQSLLRQLLDALRDPASGQPRVGVAWFDEARFSGGAWFGSVRFAAEARFGRAKFSDGAWFDEATFSGVAWFDEATFSGDAWFGRAKFSDVARFISVRFAAEARFDGVTFSGDAWFGKVRFAAEAQFEGVTFSADARFDWARFAAHACFEWATFEKTGQLGPLVCQGTLVLSRARFASPVTLEAAAARLECQRTRWDSTAALRLRYASVDLSDAVFEYPLSVTARPAPFPHPSGRGLPEGELIGNDSGVRMESLQGADAAHLVLHDVDLSGCLLSGTVHLDQLRLEGECPLAPIPAGLRRRGLLPVRWTARRTLAEEQHWRHMQGLSGWTEAPYGVEVVGPAGLAPVYRQLRKSFEDSKNEPDAADFYYGEMEMRRHDRKRPRAERALLAVYWAVSGYGLRATRALGWLLGAMAGTVLVMMLWGLPLDDPKPATTGRLAGQDISLTTDKPDPVNPSGPLRTRLTPERWEKSLRTVVNSVVFRSSGQDLSTAGIYTEMASRLAEPVLLGLAVLAIRGRVKR